jgi:hypothetical protein
MTDRTSADDAPSILDNQVLEEIELLASLMTKLTTYQGPLGQDAIDQLLDGRSDLALG